MSSRFEKVLPLLAFGFAILAPASASFADIQLTPVAHATIGDAAPTAQDLPVTLKIEHLAGLAAWLPVGTFHLTANSTQDAQVVINYAGDPYAAVITVRAEFLGMHEGHESWLLNVTRQDMMNSKPYSIPATSQLTLDRGGPGIRLVTHGHFGSQTRNLRLGFTLDQ